MDRDVRSKLPPIVSAAAAIALAVYIAPIFLSANLIWYPGYYGEFGLRLQQDSNVVADVVAGSPADTAGVRRGDIVSRPHSLRTRLLVAWSYTVAPHPGERLTIVSSRGERPIAHTLKARPMPPLARSERLLLATKYLWLFTFVVVALTLVLLSPSAMTWGFYLFALNLALILGISRSLVLVPSILSYAPAGWLVAYALPAGILAPVGLAGFLVFCARFPTNAATGWRKIVEGLAPFLAVPFVHFFLLQDAEGIRFQFGVPAWQDYAENALIVAAFVAAVILLIRVYIKAGRSERGQTMWILLGVIAAGVVWFADSNLPALAIFVLATAVILTRYFSARGLERQRIKWVIFGSLCAVAASAVDFLWGGIEVTHAAWYVCVLESLYVVLPLTVAYAVVRHRVIDVRFVASRALALGVLTIMVTAIVIGVDWLFSNWLPTSRLEAVVYVGLALIVGFSLNATWRSIGRGIDLVFFRRWYRTRKQAENIADCIRHSSSKSDLYEPLTLGIAGAFSLASSGLFERVDKGGFVRVAAYGWPAGMIWHILQDDALAVRTIDHPGVVDLDAFHWNERNLPGGVARPTVMVPITTGRSASAILLCGAHADGTGLDPDEVRAIRKLCAEAGLTYGRSLAAESEPAVSIHGHREPLGA